MICQIFGASGFAKEVYAIAIRLGYEVKAFIDKEGSNYGYLYDVPIIPEKVCNYNTPILIGIGNPQLRYTIVQKILSKNKYANFPSIIDPDAKLLIPNTINIGIGSVICAGTIITCDVQLGNFTHLNLSTTVGHDFISGDYFTTAPSVNISGKAKVGNKVYFGNGSSCKECINIVDNVTIGMGAMVVKDIKESGVYIGIPAKKV